MLPLSLLGLAVSVGVAFAATDGDYFVGDGTSYNIDPPKIETGNCNFLGGYLDNDMDIYAALNAEQWDLMECGRCAEVRCIDSRCSASLQNQTHVVHVVDKCPECLHGALDMAPTVYKQITGVGPDRYKIRWRWVDCPNLKGNIQYCLQKKSQSYWGAVQIANALKPVASVKINDDPVNLMTGAYYFQINKYPVDYSKVKVEVTSIYGETITDTVSLSAGGCTVGTHQFTVGPNGAGTTAPTATTAAPTPTTTTTPTSTTTAPPTTPTSTTKAPATTTPPPSTTAPAGGAALYGQCGGRGWTGPTVCSQGHCVATNDWYSQCQP